MDKFSVSLMLLLPAITLTSISAIADKPLDEDRPVAIEEQESTSESMTGTPVSEDSSITTMTTSMSSAENAEMEEVVTTGIKSSLMDALEIKRNKIGVTEIITAEDVGKFPDGNIAEALARVSGIAIDRSNIEGKEVTVRGMGAQYNMVTLNQYLINIS